MNKNQGTQMTDSIPSPSTPPPPMPRKKRRWWVYLIAVLGVLFVLAVGVVLAIVLYINSLVKTYAQPTPQELPKVEVTPAAQQQLKNKWAAFATSLNNSTARTRPLELTPDEINVAIATMAGGLRNHLRVYIEDDQLKAKFALPAGDGGSKGSKWLNGDAKLKLELDGNGFLSLHATDAKVNGKPLPGWAFKKLKNQNLVSFWDRDYDVLEFLQKIDNIDVRDGVVVLTPYVPEPK